jgi:hypothetical protein
MEREKPFMSFFDAKTIQDRYDDDTQVAQLVAEYKRARAYVSGLVALVRVHRPTGCGALLEYAAKCPEGQMEGDR